MDPVHVRELADGRPYTGRQALQLGLVDQIGGEPEAREWLAQAKGVSADLPIREIKERGLAWRLFVGDFDGAMDYFLKAFRLQWVNLDEPRALWQPE
jgi:protease-4